MTVLARPLWVRFSLFLIPLMIANVLQALSGTINSIYLGQMIGVEALAAASVFFPVIIFIISFIIGLSSGATVLIGQAWGARNLDKVKQVAGTTLVAALVGGIVVGVLGALFTPQILSVLGAPADILEPATSYGRIMLIGMPALFVFFVLTSLLRGVGDSITPLYGLVISIIVGLVVTPALIQGWAGLPRIGIDAAAVATNIGFVAVIAFLWVFLRWRKHPVAPDAALLRHLRIDGAILMQILRIGVPAAIQMVVSSIAAIVVIGLVNGFGSNATAAYGAVNQVMSYVQFPAMTIAIAASIFGAQTIGAGHPEQLGRVTRVGLVANLLLTGTFIILAYIFSERLVSLFITDPEVIALTESLLRVVLWSSVLFGWSAVFSGIMRSSGVVLVPMVLQLATIIVVEVPLAILLSRTELGLVGIWWAYAASFSTMLVLQAGYYWFFWRRRKIKALV